MRRLPYYWLDVFADQPFHGNPLCVILDGTGLTDAQMQSIARETNLSETTFVLPPTRLGATYRNRIFTPSGELAFAGHPTLGTAAALALSGRLQGSHAVQETQYGLTSLDLEYRDGVVDRVVMAAPAPVPVEEPDPGRVADALGLAPAQVQPGGLRPRVFAAGIRHLVVPLESPTVLANVKPALQALVDLCQGANVEGVYPFAPLPAGGPSLARARLFAPVFGIAEDPATGSAAAPLGAYLALNGLLPPTPTAFWYEQGIEMGRPSRLWVEVQSTPDGLQVRVGGAVRLVGTGEFFIG